MNSGNILALRTFGRFTYVFIGDFPQVTAFIAAKDANEINKKNNIQPWKT